MTKTKKPRVYCDACIYIKVFNKEEFWDICKRVIKDAEFDLIEIIYSYAGVTESHSPKEFLKINNGNQLIQDYFDTQKNIIKVNVDRFVSLKAREIQENAPLDRKGKKVDNFDAIHLATAILTEVDAFFTYDDKVLRLNGLPCVNGLKICQPERFWDKNLSFNLESALDSQHIPKETTNMFLELPTNPDSA